MLEVLVGIVVGPQVLGLVRAQGAAEVLYLLGLGFLLFLAGQDVRPERFRGPTFRLAGTAFDERRVTQPSALRSAGWRVVQVLGTEWEEDPGDVVRRLVAAVAPAGAPSNR